MAFRVAVASSDGRNVDLHFGQAGQFLIYDVGPEDSVPVEKRRVEIAGHADFGRVAAALRDCSAVIVSRIGPAAARALLQSGLRVLEAPYPVDAVLEKLRRENRFAGGA